MPSLNHQEALVAIAAEIAKAPGSEVLKVLGGIWLGMRIQEGDPELARRIRNATFVAPEYRGELIGRFDQWLAEIADSC